MSEVNDWNATDASNTALGSISLVEGVTTVDQINDIARAIMGANKRQLGAVNIATTVASAATTDLNSTTGWVVAVTGTTTITGLGTATAGTVKILRFSGILTLTYHATNLILPGASNITTAANDVAVFVSLGSGSWYCANYQRQAIGAIGAWELVASGTPSSVATIDIINLSAFRSLRLTGLLRPATDNTTAILTVSSNNGSSFITTNYGNQYAYASGTAFTAGTLGATSNFPLSVGANITNVAAGHLSFICHLFDFNQVANTPFLYDGTGRDTAGGNIRYFGSGHYAIATALNAIRINFSPGNIASGYYVLEGIRS